MAKDFPSGDLAYKPSAPDDVPMPKIVPTMPAKQNTTGPEQWAPSTDRMQ